MAERLIKQVLQVAHHRNGIAGAPFYVVRFTAAEDKRPMVGIVFEEPANVAVLDTALLAQGVITFGDNSWRGDQYAPELRAAIARYEKGRA